MHTSSNITTTPIDSTIANRATPTQYYFGALCSKLNNVKKKEKSKQTKKLVFKGCSLPQPKSFSPIVCFAQQPNASHLQFSVSLSRKTMELLCKSNFEAIQSLFSDRNLVLNSSENSKCLKSKFKHDVKESLIFKLFSFNLFTLRTLLFILFIFGIILNLCTCEAINLSISSSIVLASTSVSSNPSPSTLLHNDNFHTPEVVSHKSYHLPSEVSSSQELFDKNVLSTSGSSNGDFDVEAKKGLISRNDGVTFTEFNHSIVNHPHFGDNNDRKEKKSILRKLVSRRSCPSFDFKSWIIQQKCPNWKDISAVDDTDIEIFDPASCERESLGTDDTNKKSSHQSSNKSTNLNSLPQPTESLRDPTHTLLPEIPTVPVASVRKEDMLSFSEWRRKIGEQMDSVQRQQKQQQRQMLHQQQQLQSQDANIGSGNGKGQTSVLMEKLPQHVKLVIDHARNFASHECGAKIVDSNSESQFGNRALNEHKDDYMLNPCQASNWFVVELCETIQPQYLEIANFELYSSIPKEFSVVASEHYPPRNEWSNLGSNFTAQDVRTLQGFKLLNNGFVKYLKISLKSYHGDKHFCPISVVRIFGTSLFDEVDHIDKPTTGTSSDLNGDVSYSSLPEIPVQPDEDSSSVEESLGDKDRVDIFGNAKNAVMNIFVKALNFQLINKIIENVSSNRNQSNLNFDIHKQMEVASNYENFEAYLNKCERYFMENAESDRSSSASIPSKCLFLRFTYHTDLFDQLYTQYFIRKYIDPNLFQQCGINETYSELNVAGLSRIISDSVALIRSQLNNSRSLTSGSTFDTTSESSELEKKNQSNDLGMNINLSTSNYGGTLTNVVTNIESSQIQPTIMQTVINTLPLPTSATVESALPTVATPIQRETSTPFSSSSVIKDIEVLRNIPNIALPHQDGENKEVLSSSGGHSKEAVIVRLNNRIKNLESNISLMSAYLEDLSVRYRTQMEEMQMMFNRTINHLNNTAIRAAEKDAKQQINILALEAEIVKLKFENEQVLYVFEAKNWTHLKVHIILMFLEFFLVTIIGIIFYLVFKRISTQIACLAQQQRRYHTQNMEDNSMHTCSHQKNSPTDKDDIYILANDSAYVFESENSSFTQATSPLVNNNCDSNCDKNTEIILDNNNDKENNCLFAHHEMSSFEPDYRSLSPVRFVENIVVGGFDSEKADLLDNSRLAGCLSPLKSSVLKVRN